MKSHLIDLVIKCVEEGNLSGAQSALSKAITAHGVINQLDDINQLADFLRVSKEHSLIGAKFVLQSVRTEKLIQIQETCGTESDELTAIIKDELKRRSPKPKRKKSLRKYEGDPSDYIY